MKAFNHNFINGWLDQAQVSLKKAAGYDKLSPQPSLSSGKLYLQTLDYYGSKKEEILKLAEVSLLKAINRNPADYKSYQRLSNVYANLAKISTGQERQKFKDISFASLEQSVAKYPSSAKLRISLAIAAEDMDKIDIAIENYKKAVDIEQAYRKQFAIMYPDRKLFSRLGEEKFQLAKQRVQELQSE